MTGHKTQTRRRAEPRRWLAHGTPAATALAVSHPLAADREGAATPGAGTQGFLLTQAKG